jgi:4a-hydroxytetrahydrobiopterin dehydratase
MSSALTRSAFAATHDLPDWRIMAFEIEALFSATGFQQATTFAHRIAVAADAAGHHPDIDIRYPGRVRVMLTTHDANGLTDRDAQLARTISSIATELGLRSEPQRIERTEIAIDALDFDAVLPFWRAVMAYVDERPRPPMTRVDALVDPLRIGPALWFQQMDVPRPQRNRIHIDLRVPHDVAEARIGAALAAGGVLVNESYAKAFWVLADPEGNEVCICTWQDRD